MARRKADARDIFELMEACRFGGDFERLKSILDQCSFDSPDSKSALIVLQSGRSPATREEVALACEALLKRRVAAADRRKRTVARNRRASGETV